MPGIDLAVAWLCYYTVPGTDTAVPAPETPAVEQLAMQAGSFSMPCSWDPERAVCLQLSVPCPSSYKTPTSVSSDPSHNQD